MLVYYYPLVAYILSHLGCTTCLITLRAIEMNSIAWKPEITRYALGMRPQVVITTQSSPTNYHGIQSNKENSYMRAVCYVCADGRFIIRTFLPLPPTSRSRLRSPASIPLLRLPRVAGSVEIGRENIRGSLIPGVKSWYY